MQTTPSFLRTFTFLASCVLGMLVFTGCTTTRADLIILGESGPIMEYYVDYGCANCASFHSGALLPTYLGEVQDGKLRIHIKDLPRQANSRDMHIAAHCAFEQGEEPYLALVQRMYAEQRTMRRSILFALGEELELGSAYRTCLEEDRYADLLEQAQLHASQQGITETPTVFLGSMAFMGDIDLPSFFDAVADFTANE